ncbi:hypothetical protein [Agrobacterium tumefaciens]|uniref:hypothetical protein n=2 Tax=Agrobacterium tumefaciens TaxID=358 RepID=UPI000B74B4AE|nr:hypothetical protein [Agrobacterium tumefaciens]OVE92010.1 hypothetical protein B7W89_06325 [Agrobacterium tumefaciens]UXS23795.1 hypothetical protein FY153_04725 [Agrobacterium tumefaciens]UXS51959.1 hypothetical protein FY148_04535 [Agrobacterium tumefaciens]
MSAASVAVMYSDRKKTARAFVKFFCFFSERLFPPSKGRGKKPGTAGFLVKSETNDALMALGKCRRGSRSLWTSFFVFVGKSPQNRAFAGTPIKGPRVFPDQNQKAYSFVVKPA